MSEADIEALRERVKKTWFAYTSAKEQTAERERELAQWGDVPLPDAHYEIQSAQRRETEALREYRDAVRALNAAVLPLNHQRFG